MILVVIGKYLKKMHHVLFFAGSLMLMTNAFSEETAPSFDHFDTTFPLTGMHIDVACGECHKDGIFKGTPQQCFVCHNGIRATGKSVGHVPSDDNCDNCHTTFDMADAQFEHF